MEENINVYLILVFSQDNAQLEEVTCRIEDFVIQSGVYSSSFPLSNYKPC